MKDRNTKRCVYCGAKVRVVVNARKENEPTIFHRTGCKLAETRDPKTGKSEAERLYPHLTHGGYV